MLQRRAACARTGARPVPQPASAWRRLRAVRRVRASPAEQAETTTPTPTTPPPPAPAARLLESTAASSGLADRYTSLLREFREAKTELGGAAWLAQWRREHGGARPTAEDARSPGASPALAVYVRARERLLHETPVLREELMFNGGGVAAWRVIGNGGGGGGGGDGAAADNSSSSSAAPRHRSARAQAALTLGVAADYRKRRATEQQAVDKLEETIGRVVGGQEEEQAAGMGAGASSSRVRAAAMAALAYKKNGVKAASAAQQKDDMPKPSSAVSVLTSLLKELPKPPATTTEVGEGGGGEAASVRPVVETAKGDVAAAMAATPRGRDKRRVDAAEGAGLAQVV